LGVFYLAWYRVNKSVFFIDREWIKLFIFLFTILDKDILAIKPKEILNTKVVYTIVGGKIRYQAK
jgi:hypothetical protein